MSDALLTARSPAPADLLTAADADAEALADRLHDGALQVLLAARFAADVAVRGGDPSAVRDSVQTALVALRREVWALRPRGAHDLPGALDQLSAQRVAAGGLSLDLDAADAPGLPDPAGALAYRFVQAAATEPGPVRVRLRCGPDAAVVEVTGGVLDAATWQVRADAVGGRYEPATDSGPARLHLPLRDADLRDPEGDR